MEYVQNSGQQQLANKLTIQRAKAIILFSLSFIFYIFAMRWRVGLEVVDDGAFFLRYAQNMLAGQFWVWNLGEAPVWGASAPFYPVFLAMAMFIGLSPEHSIIVVGSLLTALSFSLLVLLLARRLSLAAALAFLIFTAMDSSAMYFAVGGLESPLTFFLLSLAVFFLLESKNLWLIGVSAGLLMINKLDLIPVGGLVLLALWVRDRLFPARAFLIAGIIAIAWYGFAWVHFGAPIPNSFLTKSLHQGNLPKVIDWTWFGNFVYLDGAHKWLTFLAIAALCINTRKNLNLLLLLAGTLAIHTIAYTIKYPFEPYSWYCMPSIFCLTLLACIGINNILTRFTYKTPARKIIISIVTIAFLATYIYKNKPDETVKTELMKEFTGLYEHDRAEAGRWVNAHTPKNFKVLTSWGNPAFYSQREVIDGSFLNRVFESENLLEKYRPEIVILQAPPETNPMQPKYWVMDKGYKVIKIFDETYAYGKPYFFSVLAREDVIDKITDVTPPKDYFSLLSGIKLGDKFGILRVNDQSTLFIHPGEKTPTEATLNTAAFREKFHRDSLKVKLAISPLISPEAVARGAGNVRVTLDGNTSVLMDAVVTATKPATQEIDIKDIDSIHISVDNNGGADTDWLLLTIQ